MKKVRSVLAVVMFVVGLGGTLLAIAGIVGSSEPRLTHTLSWLALAYAGFVAIEVS